MKLELSDGQRSLNLLSGGSIYAVQEGFDLPLPGRDVTYIDPVDGDGRRRIRSKDTNGEGRIQAMISGTTDANFWDNVDNLLELVQSAHRNRGSITYTPPKGSNEITWDLEAITVSGLPQRGQQLGTRRAECEISFETRPYGKLAGTTINLAGTLAPKTLSGPIDYATVGGIAGQIQAFAELKLTDTSSQNRRHVEIGVQDVFDPSNPEPLLLTAGSMTAAGGTLGVFAGVAGTAGVPAGAYTTSGTVPYAVKCTVAQSAITMLGTGRQPHSGLWKVRARVNATDPAIRIRLAWRVGEGQFTREQWRILPSANRWVDLDLGTIDIPKLPSGHIFEARLEGIGEVGFPAVFVDYMTFVPADRFLRLRGLEVLESASRLVAGDDFQNHPAGTINGKTPPLTPGGNWVTSGGSVDFVVSKQEVNVLTRAGTNDATSLAGRFAQFGTVNYDEVEFSSDLFPYPSLGGTYIDYPGSPSGTLGDFSKGQAGVVLRYKDTDNHVKVFYTRNVYQRQVNMLSRFEIGRQLIPGRDPGQSDAWAPLYQESTIRTIVAEFDYLSLHLQKVVGGTVTALGQVDFGPIQGNTTAPIGGNRRIRAIAGTAGDIEVWEGPNGGDLVPQITYAGDAQLATGGTLDSGRIGLYHTNGRGTADTTKFYGMTAQDPTPASNIQPAINAGNAVEVTHDAAYTLAGTVEDRAPTPIREGEYLQLEPSTRNSGKSRIVVKARRGDVDLGEADTGLSDQIEARLKVTPRVTLK